MSVSRLLAVVAIAALLPASIARGQQGSVQVSGAVQSTTGDSSWLVNGQPTQPDVGILWRQRGTRVGSAIVDAHITAGGDRPKAGRASLQLLDMKRGSTSWTVGAGDLAFTPSLSTYHFANLSTPMVTYTGGSIGATSERTTFNVSGGRTTLIRDIFGNDPIRLGQTVAVASLTHRIAGRVDLLARASRVRTQDLGGFSYTIAASDQVGGGVRYAWTPAIHLVADGSFVAYRPVGAPTTRRDSSAVVGASWLLSRGWIEVNATRFSPGELPALNVTLQDRQGLFAAGEYGIGSRLRLFSGWDSFRTNLDPVTTFDGVLRRQVPIAFGARRFGGAQLKLAERTSLFVRAEQGDRLLRPVLGGFDAVSDTGSQSIELQTSAGRAHSFLHYTRRQNVDHQTLQSSYTEHDASAQLFIAASRRTELFGLAGVVENRGVAASADTPSSGQISWQLGGGLQQQLSQNRLSLRAEGTTSGNLDVLSSRLLPRQSLTLGLNGQLTDRTTLGFNAYLYHSPTFSSGVAEWRTRSTLRVVHTIPTGSESAAALGSTLSARTKATGIVAGLVYADWNRNGMADPDENALGGIRIRIAGRAGSTGRDGRFRMTDVPVGLQQIGLDMSQLPVDYDPPDVNQVQAEVSKGEAQQFRFGLIPLGGIRGKVLQDSNGNGRADGGDNPISEAVVVLDGGARSELVKNGRYRFDAVRSGEHTVTLLQESLPVGAQIADSPEARVAVTRDHLTQDVTFLVALERRDEIRRVFPEKRAAIPTQSTPGPAVPEAVLPTNATRSAARSQPQVRRSPAAGTRGRFFLIQVAALRDAAHARALADELQQRGVPAFVVEPDQHASLPLFRVRVGGYTDRADAERSAADLRPLGDGGRLWIVEQKPPRGGAAR